MDNKDEKALNDQQLKEADGGSWYITEEDGKAAGLELKNLDGTAGSWGYVFNSGDYYWKGHYLDIDEANAIVHFTKDMGRQPETIKEATDKYKAKF